MLMLHCVPLYRLCNSCIRCIEFSRLASVSADVPFCVNSPANAGARAMVCAHAIIKKKHIYLYYTEHNSYFTWAYCVNYLQ